MRVEQAVQQPPLHAAPVPQGAFGPQGAWQASPGLERARVRAAYSPLSREPTHQRTTCCVRKRPRACAAAHLTATAASSSSGTIRRSAPPMLGQIPRPERELSLRLPATAVGRQGEVLKRAGTCVPPGSGRVDARTWQVVGMWHAGRQLGSTHACARCCHPTSTNAATEAGCTGGCASPGRGA